MVVTMLRSTVRNSFFFREEQGLCQIRNQSVIRKSNLISEKMSSVNLSAIKDSDNFKDLHCMVTLGARGCVPLPE